MDHTQTWPPYPTPTDCSEGICSMYCPQWCYFLFPPTPPSSSSSSPVLSPFLIAVVAILAAAFLLATYYTILSKFRRHFQSLGRHPGPAPVDDGLPTWHAPLPGGLDESLINKITACQYRTGDGLIVDDTNCSVCLSQFQDGETLRLLPRCSHAFHLRCIDTWLKSHSTCPLCRTSIVPTVDPEGDRTDQTAVFAEEGELGSEGDAAGGGPIVNSEINENGFDGIRSIGRSLSMDSPFRRQVSTADVGTSRWSRALHCVMSPVQMKRSSSTGGRLNFTMNGRGRSPALPI